MCLLVAKPANGIVLEAEMLCASKNNPNGMGVVVAKNEELIVYKSMDNFEEFWRVISTNMAYPMVIHFRFATHGTTNEFNVHPFAVNENLYIAHNGVISAQTGHSRTDVRSDTRYYVDETLKKLPKNFLGNEGIRKLISKDIGPYNKFAFLDNKGKITIINATSGAWSKEEVPVWYSNQSHKPSVFDRGGRSVGGTTSTSYSKWDDDFDGYPYSRGNSGSGHWTYNTKTGKYSQATSEIDKSKKLDAETRKTYPIDTVSSSINAGSACSMPSSPPSSYYTMTNVELIAEYIEHFQDVLKNNLQASDTVKYCDPAYYSVSEEDRIIYSIEVGEFVTLFAYEEALNKNYDPSEYAKDISRLDLIKVLSMNTRATLTHHQRQELDNILMFSDVFDAEEAGLMVAEIALGSAIDRHIEENQPANLGS